MKSIKTSKLGFSASVALISTPNLPTPTNSPASVPISDDPARSKAAVKVALSAFATAVIKLRPIRPPAPTTPIFNVIVFSSYLLFLCLIKAVRFYKHFANYCENSTACLLFIFALQYAR